MMISGPRITWVILTSLFLSLTSFGQDFSFAWLSDTHVGGSTGADDLRLTVADLNTIDSLDFVVLSGDITEMGWISEFRETHDILSGLRIPYYIIPGNHDMKWSESGGQEFVRIFGSDRFVFGHNGFLFVGMHQGPVLRMGDGHFPPEDVRWLDSLAGTIDPQTKLVFVTHYPLTPSIDNWYEATNRLRQLNTQAVLVGHGHSDRVLEFEGLPGVMGRSNLRARREHGGFTIVQVSSDSMRFSQRVTGQHTDAPRHALPLTDRTYETKTAAPPSDPLLDRFPRGRMIWSVRTGWTMTGSPVVSGNRVYIADRSGTVRCLKVEDGSIMWSARAPGPVLGNPYANQDHFIGTTTNGHVFCMDARTGETRWIVKTGHANVASPVIRDGAVYVGSSNGTFFALHVRDGSRIWVFDGVSAFVEARPLVTDAYVIFGAWDSYLYCLDRTTGSLVWKWNNGSEARLLSPAAVWPVASGNHLFVVAPDRAATVLDIRTGAIVWRSGRHQVRESAGLSTDGSRFYAKSMNDTLFAYRASSTQEDLVWMADCGYGYDIANSMPVEHDGVVFFGTKNGLVFAVDAETGKVRWLSKHGNTIINTVAPASKGRVVVSSLDGHVALIGPEHP